VPPDRNVPFVRAICPPFPTLFPYTRLPGPTNPETKSQARAIIPSASGVLYKNRTESGRQESDGVCNGWLLFSPVAAARSRCGRSYDPTVFVLCAPAEGIPLKVNARLLRGLADTHHREKGGLGMNCTHPGRTTTWGRGRTSASLHRHLSSGLDPRFLFPSEKTEPPQSRGATNPHTLLSRGCCA